MLEGEEGVAIRRCMEILVKTGDFIGAKNFVKIVGAYSQPEVSEDFGIRFMTELAKLGAEVKVPTTLGWGHIDRNQWEKYGVTPESAKKWLDYYRALESMGCITPISMPYMLAQPGFGEHWADGGTVGTIFNTFFGARCNVEGPINAFASAIVGRALNYGFHLKENRYGNILVKVKADLQIKEDWTGVGYIVGKELKGDWTKVPVVTGLPYDRMNKGLLLALSGGLQTAGGPTMLWHCPGRTPEAPTLEAAFGPNKTVETITVETNEVIEVVNTFTDYEGPVDIVNCTATIWDLKEWATALRSKKVHEDVHLWLSTNTLTKAISDVMGLTKIIEDAGGLVITDTGTFDMLTVPSVFTKERIKDLGYKFLVTNGLFAAHYLLSNPIDAYFRPMELCIEVALTGEAKPWRR